MISRDEDRERWGLLLMRLAFIEQSVRQTSQRES